MIQQKQIELYVFLHSMRNGILTVSPQASIVRQAQLPIHEVEVECAGAGSSKILLRLPEYLAIGKSLIQPGPQTMTDAPRNRINEGGGELAKIEDKVETRPDVGASPIKPPTPTPVMSDAPAKRFDQLSESEQDRHMERAFFRLIKPKINEIDDEIKASGGLNGGQA